MRYNVRFIEDSSEKSKSLLKTIKKARKEGKVAENFELLTGYSELVERDNEFVCTIVPAVHPSDQTARAVFSGLPELFRPPLSVITNVYTGKNLEKSEYYLVQKRNRKGVDQGQMQIATASAGFIIYGMDAEETARKETEEEIGISVRDLIVCSDAMCRTSDGIVMHYLGPKRLKNPCFVYSFFVKSTLETRQNTFFINVGINEYRIVRTLKEIDNITEERNQEVFAACAVPVEKLEPFWQEVYDARRIFGPSLEVVKNYLAGYAKD